MIRKANRLGRFRPVIEILEARRLMSVNADFDGDGFDDLAIGVPGEDSDAGVVHVIYGTSAGLSSTGSQLWSQDSVSGSLQVPDTKEAGDEFGAALAGGDFNGDGFADLAIGVPGETLGSAVGTGAVNVLYGSASGLRIFADNNVLWNQDSDRVSEVSESDDGFGSALAAGDFNRDGRDDLAIGVSGEDTGGHVDAGGIQVLYGEASGLAPTNGGAPLFNLDHPSIPGVHTADDFFGGALSAGDFNGDTRDDLAIGVSGFDPSGVEFGGAVCIMNGSSNGLIAPGSQLWNQDSPGITGGAEDPDRFGFSVAAGDFNGDGRDDVAIGVPFENSGVFQYGEGLVHVLYGSTAGITATGSDAFNQGDVNGVVEGNDGFGWSLAAADFNNDGRFDLAIGAFNERQGLFANGAGVVNVAFGSSSGIVTSTAIEIWQEDVGTGEQSESNDFFGWELGAGDFNGNGRSDLAIAAPGEGFNFNTEAGRVFVLYGGSSFSGGQAWDQDSPGISGGAEAHDRFGDGLDANGGRSSDGDRPGSRDLAQLVSADFDFDTPLTKLNRRRIRNGSR